MRPDFLRAIGRLVCAGAVVGLAGCTAKDEVAPGPRCGTKATVRLCHGFTAMCLTEHTTLELADGTRLLPSGPAWEAYLPHQADRQVLSIGYRLGAALPAGDVGNVRAALTCLNTTAPRGGTPGYGGN